MSRPSMPPNIEVEEDTGFEDMTVSDRISELPDEILHTIVSKLTLREAVRMSVLSSRWRYISSLLSCLVFDWRNMFKEPEGNELCKDSRKHCLCEEYKDAFTKSVNQFLGAYRYGVRKLSLFRVHFCLGQDSRDEIDKWVKLALEMGAERLKLILRCKDNRCGWPVASNDDRMYIIRNDLLLGGGSDKLDLKLKRLSLWSCNFETNYHRLFSHLGILRLCYIPLARYHNLESMISCLGNLKKLSLRHCILPASMCLRPLVSLQDLLVQYCLGIKKVDMPLNLVNFKHFGYHKLELAFDVDLGAPKLEYSRISANQGPRLGHVFTDLHKHLLNLKTLRVRCTANWVEFMPKSVGIFSKVTNLRLIFTLHTNFGMLQMISLLQGFPLLKIFHFLLNCPQDVENQEGMMKTSSVVHGHLEKVINCGFYSTSGQIDFCIYLLENAPKLKELQIHHKVCKAYSRRSSFLSKPLANEEECQKVRKRLLPFSKKVRVIVD